MPEMQQQRLAVVERGQDVLGAAAEALDPPPDQALGQPLAATESADPGGAARAA